MVDLVGLCECLCDCNFNLNAVACNEILCGGCENGKLLRFSLIGRCHGLGLTN